VKKLFQFTVGLWLSALAVLPAAASFSSLYVFGDALSATTDNPEVGPLYYGQRYSNGRIWIEVLAQRQGLTYDSGKNNSYYDHNSSELAAELNSFVAPADVTNDLFIVWVCNADSFDVASNPDSGSSDWIAAINQAQTNHLQIITNLYAMGVRTLILPNVVDFTEVPEFAKSTSTNIVHNGCVAYNLALSNTINQARTLCPRLAIFTPDFFKLLNNVETNAAYYGLTNALEGGYCIDALSANGLDPAHFPPAATNGFGTNFIFWDDQDPTAQLHAVIADVVQQIISSVRVGKITSLAGSNRLDIINYPAGLNGFVDGITNLALTNWTSVQNFSSTTVTQSVFVPITGPKWFFRLHFPYAWSWP
jgi:phospholipase/lecithinase/hemolysin